jgi:hypothetical protein
MMFSYLRVHLKLGFGGKDLLRLQNLNQLTSRGFYILTRTAKSRAQMTADAAVRGRIMRMVIGYSAGNYPFMDRESTGGMVITPGIVSASTFTAQH